MPVIAENIPEALKWERRWLNWRWAWDDKKQKWNKPPMRQDGASFGSSTDPDSWVTFDEAFEAYQTNTRLDGIGFALGDGWAVSTSMIQEIPIAQLSQSLPVASSRLPTAIPKSRLLALASKS